MPCTTTKHTVFYSCDLRDLYISHAQNEINTINSPFIALLSKKGDKELFISCLHKGAFLEHMVSLPACHLVMYTDNRCNNTLDLTSTFQPGGNDRGTVLENGVWLSVGLLANAVKCKINK